MLYTTIPKFLGAELNRELLDFADASRSNFLDTGVGVDSEVHTATRVSKRLSDLREYREKIERRVLEKVPELLEQLRMSRFSPTGCEIELVAHEDGAFYRRHIDVFTDKSREKLRNDRLLTVVYYLFRQPKMFSGGELRLYPIPSISHKVDEYIDVAPENDVAVAFSSWVPHEVRPIRCSAGQFRDARFAINCWVLRSHTAAQVI